MPFGKKVAKTVKFGNPIILTLDSIFIAQRRHLGQLNCSSMRKTNAKPHHSIRAESGPDNGSNCGGLVLSSRKGWWRSLLPACM